MDVTFGGTYNARWILYLEVRIYAAIDTIYWGTYSASRWSLLSTIVSHDAMDAWKHMFSMCPGLRDNGCVSLGQTCIIILQIAFHYIALIYYLWTSSFVLLIFWMPFCELVTDEYWSFCWDIQLIECSCWGYEIVRVLFLRIFECFLRIWNC